MARLANKLRAVFSLMCLDLTPTDENSETDDNKSRVRKHTRTTKSAKTHFYPRNTLMGLPTELRLIIYKFTLQDVVDSIVNDSIAGERRLERRLTSYMFALHNVTDASVHGRMSPSSILRRNSIRLSQHPPRLGGMALPLTTRTLRKESLDIYGPLLKAHQHLLWEYYIGLQNTAQNDALGEQDRLLDAEVDAYLQWRAVGCLQRVINCMYVNECYVRGYRRELHTEAKMSEWLARV